MKRPTRIPTKGRRATILRATSRAALTTTQVCAAIRAQMRRSEDPAIFRFKTNEALRHMRQAGFVALTPHGWTATADGLQLLETSELAEGRT